VKELHDNRTIMLDFDQRQVPRLRRIFTGLRWLGLGSPKWIRTDRTAHGWHVIVKLRQKLTDGEIIAAQAVLGSDLKRETLNLKRAIAQRTNPQPGWGPRINLLFSEKTVLKK